MQIHTEEKRRIARETVKNNPTVPSRQLGRILFAKHPMLWTTFSSAYHSVLRLRGAHGDWHRKQVQLAGVTPPPVTMPDSMADDWEPHVLPDGRWLVMSDLHVPFHDVAAIACAVKAGKDRNATGIILNGDICDFYSISKFDKDPTKVKLIKEIAATRQLLRWMKQELPKASIVFKLGNHDERLEKFIYGRSAEFIGLPQLRFDHVMAGAHPGSEDVPPDAAIHGIEFVADQRNIVCGKLNILHGHEYGRGSIAPAVNPARGAFLRLLECSLTGHNHRASAHDETSATGKLISCWSTGCLCDLSPEYARINKWNHSAAFVVKKGEDFTVEALRILKGRLL